MSILTPRVIIVRRETEFERVRSNFANVASARFVLNRKGIDLAKVEAAHERFGRILQEARAAIPADWRQAILMRSEIERFVFGPEDIVLAVGQDGLVANVAKYLDGQTVIGVNPAPGENAGQLVRFAPADIPKLLPAAAAGRLTVERRVMAEAKAESGERLLALNEIFVGHRSHQSARYTLELGEKHERQSSSGLIIATGTGATGWAKSIMAATHKPLPLPPTEPVLGLLVREAWESPATGASLTAGLIQENPARVTSEMDDGGVVFADGIETDRLPFPWGQTVEISPAERRLALAVPG
jgi:NAD kinase